METLEFYEQDSKNKDGNTTLSLTGSVFESLITNMWEVK